MLKNILVVYTIPRTYEQESALQSVKSALKKYRIGHSMANRDRLDKSQFNDRDLVIAVGGDGTFLRAAQFVGNQRLLGVNADARHKEGFFMKSDKHNFETKLKKIIGGECVIKSLPRLEACINDVKIDALALNEFFIGAKKSYQSAKYVIKVGNRRERQKSSGVLAATPAGSNSWAKSSCGRALPLSSKCFQYIVREPYEGRVFKEYKLKHGTLSRSQKLEVFSEMLDGILVADSVGREYSLKDGDKAAIKLSDKYLKAVWE